ncbi:MAG TPA: hypothetical protein EYP69_01585 [Bacteroidales bacterium]|nr:hypothetical protein [Bacteroidales bacterium]
MKTINLMLAICLLMLSYPMKAQNTDSQNMKVIVNQEPYYPAGDQKLYSLVYDKIVFPIKPKGTLINGKIVLSFDVLPDSSLTNIVVMQGIEEDIDQQVVNIFIFNQ